MRVARRTAATLWVTRTAPSTRPALRTGTAVARISALSVSDCRVSCTVRRRNAAAISGRLA